MLPVRAHTEKLAEHFLACCCQSHRADHYTTSSTSFCPMRPKLNDTYRDRVKQHKSKKTTAKSQGIEKCARNYASKHAPYSIEQ